MSELPPPTPPESEPEDKWPEDFVRPTPEEFAKYAGGPRYHSYESYDERAGAQAEREYAEGDTGAEPSPDVPDDTPSPDDSPPAPDDDRPTTKIDVVDPADKPSETDEERRARIMIEIEEADAINRPTKRMRALEKIAHEAQDSGDTDLAVEAASRIRTSKTREKGLSKLWVRNTLAHDQVLSDIASKTADADTQIEIADRVKFDYKRNPIVATAIKSIYSQAGEGFKDSEGKRDSDLVESTILEERAIAKEKEAQKLTSEKLHGWRSPKYFGETITFWAILRNDPDILTSLGGIRHFVRKRKAKKYIEKQTQS